MGDDFSGEEKLRTIILCNPMRMSADCFARICVDDKAAGRKPRGFKVMLLGWFPKALQFSYWRHAFADKFPTQPFVVWAVAKKRSVCRRMFLTLNTSDEAHDGPYPWLPPSNKCWGWGDVLLMLFRLTLRARRSIPVVRGPYLSFTACILSRTCFAYCPKSVLRVCPVYCLCSFLTFAFQAVLLVCEYILWIPSRLGQGGNIRAIKSDLLKPAPKRLRTFSDCETNLAISRDFYLPGALMNDLAGCGPQL